MISKDHQVQQDSTIKNSGLDLPQSFTFGNERNLYEVSAYMQVLQASRVFHLLGLIIWYKGEQAHVKSCIWEHLSGPL